MKSKNFLDKFVDLFSNIAIFSPLIKLYYKYHQIWLYLFFGVITTLINIISYQVFVTLDINYLYSNILAWAISVFIAFITNRVYVFESNEKNVVKSCLNFYISRLFTFFVDMTFMYIGITIFLVNDLLMKVIVNVVIVFINYIISKFIVFKKK